MEKLVCPNCEYEWFYTGRLAKATCPSCTGKVTNKNYGSKKNVGKNGKEELTDINL